MNIQELSLFFSVIFKMPGLNNHSTNQNLKYNKVAICFNDTFQGIFGYFQLFKLKVVATLKRRQQAEEQTERVYLTQMKQNRTVVQNHMRNEPMDSQEVNAQIIEQNIQIYIQR